MQFSYRVGVGPLPLRFGQTKDEVSALFAGFEVPSAYAGRNVSPQNAIGAYPQYDADARLWCVELSPRCSLLYGDDQEEVFDDEADDMAAHLSGLFGSAVPTQRGYLYPSLNAFATFSGSQIVSLLVFSDEYGVSRFGN